MEELILWKKSGHYLQKKIFAEFLEKYSDK